MRKLVVHEFITLDGVIQAPGDAAEDTDGGFTHGGWTLPYWHDDIGAHFGQVFAEADSILLGRKTWQIHGAAFGPNPDQDPFAGMAKYVVSTTLKNLDLWPGSNLISGNVVEAVRRLKEQPGKNIVSDGSSVLAHTLLENDLVDELLLHVYPISLGSGKRLYPDGKRVNLRLLEATPMPTGVVYQRYVPA